VWSKAPLAWRPSSPRVQELQRAEQEATTGAQFDRAGLKRGIWEAYKAGKVRLECLESATVGVEARILAFLPKGVTLPLEIWSRVIQWIGPGPWTIYWFGATTPRRFPKQGQDLGPEHVNGGYTQPCARDGIFIYRAEEATRVLVHELLHAACLDEPHWSIPQREAMIETWAELFLIALSSKGSPSVAADLWAKQLQWIADSNWRARRENGTVDISDYAWRYLVGREEMYLRLGIVLPAARSGHESGSLRFTHPSLGE
jgi:hypothetical protein